MTRPQCREANAGMAVVPALPPPQEFQLRHDARTIGTTENKNLLETVH